MKNILLLILFSLLIIAFHSCCKPGTGGEADLTVTLQHHAAIITSKANWPDTVYIKFNAKELGSAAPADFDKYFIGTAGTYTIACNGLKCGKYFLFGAGLDSGASYKYRVTGGLPFTIKHKDRKQSFDVTLAVTE